MFELEQAVQDWCQQVAASGCGNAHRIAELKDHLHCEIERLQHQGLSAEQAFQTATKQLGQQPQLHAEYAKNHNTLAGLCQHESATDESGQTAEQHSKNSIAHAILFAAAMLASAILIDDTTAASISLFILLGLWWATQTLMPGPRLSAKVEWAFMRRLFSRSKNL